MLQNRKNNDIYYTDASHLEGVGTAIINKNLTSIFKLQEICSIFTAEAIAILKIVDLPLPKKNIIFSDSLNTL